MFKKEADFSALLARYESVQIVFSDRGPCPPDNCFWCFTLHTRVSCQPSEPLRPVHRCLFLWN
ncbi:hypothetical protein EMIT0P265_30253 [Pseudomonas zeae]